MTPPRSDVEVLRELAPCFRGEARRAILAAIEVMEGREEMVGYVDGSRLHELREGRLNLALWAEPSAYANTPVYVLPTPPQPTFDAASIGPFAAAAALIQAAEEQPPQPNEEKGNG